MTQPKIIEILQQHLSKIEQNQLEEILNAIENSKLVASSESANLSLVVETLAEVALTTDDFELYLAIFNLLKNNKQRALLDILADLWVKTNNPLLNEIVSKKPNWWLADKLLPYFPDFDQKRLSNWLTDLLRFSNSYLAQVLEIYLASKEKNTFLAKLILNLLQENAKKGNNANFEVWDVIYSYWEKSQDEELFKLLPKGQDWELADSLRKFFPDKSLYAVLDKLKNLREPQYRYNSDMAFLDKLLQIYANEPDYHLPLLNFFKGIIDNSEHDVIVVDYLCEYWLKTNDADLEPLIPKTKYWELAGQLVGKLPRFQTLHLLQASFAEQYKFSESKYTDQTFLNQLGEFATSKNAKMVAPQVLAEIAAFLAEKGYIQRIYDWWEKTGDSYLVQYLPPATDEKWQLAGKLKEIYPKWTRYFAYQYFEIILDRAESWFVKDILRVALGHPEETVRQGLLKILAEIKNQENILEISTQWAESRSAELEKIILEKGWQISKADGDSALTIAVRQAFWLKTGALANFKDLSNLELKSVVGFTQDNDPVIAKNALEVLRQQPDTILSTLAKYWKESRNPHLLTIMAERTFIPATPAEARLIMTLRLDKLEDINFDKPEFVALLAEETRSLDPAIAARASSFLKKLKKAESKEALCKVIIEQDLPTAQAITLELGLLPAKTSLKALFFFVTGQFAKYDELDFDGRILRTTYETGSPNLRKRLNKIIRSAGRVDYLAALATSSVGNNLTGESEVQLLVEMLAERQDWANLWTKVLELPLKWSVQAVNLLQKAGWQPTNPTERELFERLKELTATLDLAALNEQEFVSQLPIALQRIMGKLGARINDIAFAPNDGTKLLAVATANKKVLLWNLQKGKVELVLNGFERTIRRLAFLEDGTLLCAESVNNNRCKLYACTWRVLTEPESAEKPENLSPPKAKSRQSQKQNPKAEITLKVIGEHNDAINVLVVAGSATAITSGRDGAVKYWDIPAAQLISRLNISGSDADTITHVSASNWARGGCLSHTGKMLALLCNRVVCYSLPEFQTVLRTAMGKGEFATFAPDDSGLVVGRIDGNLRVYESDKEGDLRAAPKIIDTKNLAKSPVIGITTLPAHNLLIVATRDGNIEFLEWASRQTIGRLQLPNSQLNLLQVSSNDNFMVVGNGEKDFAVWDLRTLNLRAAFSRPLSESNIEHLAILEMLLENTNNEQVQAWLTYWQAILRWRFRFAIEIADITTIQAGDFDIELDG